MVTNNSAHYPLTGGYFCGGMIISGGGTGARTASFNMADLPALRLAPD